MTVIIILGAVFIFILLWGIKTANTFKILRIKIDEADGGIDVALTKRYDMLTKMLETVKAFTTHESNILTKIVQLRSGMSIGEKMTANEQMNQLASQLNITAESYPSLKSSQNYLQLKQAISDTEYNLQAARRFYNANVSAFNQAIIVFPSSIIAGMLHLQARRFFEAEDSKRQDVQMKFD